MISLQLEKYLTEALPKKKEDVSEEKMGLPTKAIKPIMKDIEKLMKKHNVYVSDKNKDVTTVSSPKPMKGGFIKDLDKLLKVKGISW